MSFSEIPSIIWGLQIAVFVLLVLEIIIPSGGIIFAMAAIALVWAWMQTLNVDLGHWTFVFLGVDLIGIPFMIWLSLKALKKSGFTLQTELVSDEGFQSPHAFNQDLSGQVGVVTQDLRPVGKIRLEQGEFEAISEHDWIVKDSQIEVQSCQDNKIIVKKIRTEKSSP